MKTKGKFILFTLTEFDSYLKEHSFARSIKVIQNHHTAVPGYAHFKGDNHFAMVEGMENFHKTHNGWSEIAQNITTFPDGTIMLCRSLDKMPAGIKGVNQYGICIEHIGNFDLNGDTMADVHKKTIIGINALFCREFKLTPDTNSIVYHHWYDLVTGVRTNGTGAVKTCPGTNFFGGNKVEDAKEKFIPLINDYLKS